MELQTLGTNLLHHALHGGVDRSQRAVIGLHVGLQHAVPGEPHGVHHAVRTDGDDAVGILERDRLLAQFPGGVLAHRLDDVVDRGLVLGARGLEARRLVAAPHDHVGRGLDLLDLVAVDHALVAREIKNLAACPAEGLADREQHGVAEAAARQHHGLTRLDLGRCAGRAHDDHRLAGFQQRAEIGRAAHFERDQRQQALVLVDPGTGQRQPFHGQQGAIDLLRARFVILQAVELTGLEVARRRRRLDHHFDDGRRQTVDPHHLRPPGLVGSSEDVGGLLHRRRQLRHAAGQHRIALLGAAHRLHDVAGKGRMQVTEERHRPAVGMAIHQHAHVARLADALGRCRVALLVEGAEVLAVDESVRRILARQHGVGLGTRRHEDGACRKRRLDLLAALFSGHLEGAGMAVGVDLDRHRRQAFGEADVLFQRLEHFLVVQGVGRRIDQPTAVSDGDAAPAVDQPGDVGRAALAGGLRPLLADRMSVRDELVGDLALLVVHGRAHGGEPALLHQRLMADQELLDLQRIVGERFCRGIDRRQAAADHHHRQADLQVGDRVLLGSTSELQRHQEVRRRAHTARQPVGQVEHGRLAGSCAQRHVIEAHGEGVLDGHGSAEAHAAEHRELAAPLEQQTHQLQVVLVPAHRDAVLGDTAEARHGALTKILAQTVDVAHGLERHARAVGLHAGLGLRQRLDLEAVDADHGMAVVHQVMGEIESRRTEADDQHGTAGGGTRDRPAQIERVPASQQRIDLEAPGQAEHILERTRLDLGNVDRFLLLVDAGLHAVVADAMAGRRQQRIVDRRDRQRADGEALALQQVHLRDLFLERAAGQRDAERRLLEGAGLAVLETLGAAVLALVVAPDAVIGVVERAGGIEALVGQREALAVTQHRPRQLHARDAVDHLGLDRHQMLEVELVRHLEQRPVAVPPLAVGAVQRPGGILRQRLDLGCRLVDLELGADQAAHLDGEGEFPRLDTVGRIGADIDRGLRAHRIGLDRARDVALHEQPLAVVERRELRIAAAQAGDVARDAEQFADEILERSRHLDQQVGLILGRQRLRRGARRHQTGVHVGIRRLQPGGECRVEAAEALAVIEVVEAQPEGERGRGHSWNIRIQRGGIVRARTD